MQKMKSSQAKAVVKRPPGRPRGEETKTLHVRISAKLHEQLEIISFATRRSTADIIRASLDRYVQQHGDLVSAVALARDGAAPGLSQADAEHWERLQLEHDENVDND